MPLLVRNLPGNVGVSTLPSPITFADEAQPYIPGGNKQQYLRSQLPAYVPGGNKQLYLRNQLPAYAPGGNKQQYLRGYKVTKPFVADNQTPLIEIDNLPENVPVQTLPSGITFAEDLPPYVQGGNKQQYLRGSQEVGFTRSGVQGDQGVYPGVSSRPNFPPGYYPSFGRMLTDNIGSEGYEGPKNVLYFF